MKITIYELFGLVKDGKAPKKVRYNDEIYDTKSSNNFSLMIYEAIGKMSDDGEVRLFLNDEVEILEEEKKIPEKWNDLSFTTMRKREDSIDDDVHKLKGYIETIMRTQNEFIDYLKSKGE